MLFSCLPSDARIPGRFPGPPHPRGKHFTVDIHCHVLTEAAEAMFRASGAVDRRPREVFANAHTRDVNRQQVERTHVQFTSVEKRLADMDVMGIDHPGAHARAQPDLLRPATRPRHCHRAPDQRQHRRHRGTPPGSFRRPGHGAVPGA